MCLLEVERAAIQATSNGVLQPRWYNREEKRDPSSPICLGSKISLLADKDNRGSLRKAGTLGSWVHGDI